MLFALIFLLLSFLTGVYLLRLVPLTWYRVELPAAQLIIGLTFTTWVFFLICWLVGFQLGVPVALILLAVIIIGLRRLPFRNQFQKNDWASGNLWQQGLWFSVTILTSGLLIHLLDTHSLLPVEQGLATSGSSWGDLPLHLSLITHFAREIHFSWDFPLLVNSKLSYPFLVDFATSLLYRGGLSLRLSLIVVGIPLVVALPQLFFSLGYRLLGTRRAAAFSLALFVGSGSSFGFVTAWQQWRQSGISLGQFVSNTPGDYSLYQAKGLFVSNFITKMIMPQRGYLLALPLFLLSIMWLQGVVMEDDHVKRRRLLIAGALLNGALPLVHVHTFFVSFGCWLVVIALMVMRQKERRLAIGSIVLTLLLAAPQVIWQFRANYHPGFAHFQPGWTKDPSDPLWLFLGRNFGLLFGAGLLSLTLPLSKFVRYLIAIAVIIFLVCHLFLFQPYDYDNLKFMLYAYLFVGMAVAFLLDKWSRTVYLWIPVSVLFLALTASGSLSLIREEYDSHLLYTNNDIEIGKGIAQTVSADKLVLTGDYHNHPIPSLAGINIVRGYGGWLWSYGFDTAQVSNDIGLMYAGTAEAEGLLEKYHVDYVYVSPRERAQLYINDDYFHSRFKVAYSSQGSDLFDVHQAAATTAAQ